MRKFKLLKALGATLTNGWKMLDHWYIFLLYAGVMTCISTIFKKWSYACQTADMHSWCVVYSDSLIKVVLYLVTYYICLCIVFFSFGYDICNTTFKNVKFSNMFRCTKERLKYIGFYFACLIACIAPLSLAFYIIARPAEPVFSTEFVLFLIVFACVAFAMLFIRLISFIGYYINDGKMPSILQLFKATSGRAYVSIVLFSGLLLFVCIFQLRLIGSMTKLNESDTFIMAITTEYIDYIVKLLCFGLFLSSFKAQADLLQQEVQSVEEPSLSVAEDEKIKLEEDTPREKIVKAGKKKSTAKTNKGKKSTTKKSAAVIKKSSTAKKRTTQQK